MKVNPPNHYRILIIDDNRAIHHDFRKVLARSVEWLSEEETALFGEETEDSQWPVLEIDSAYQGQEGLDLIEKPFWTPNPILWPL
jgi:hypothetical protein